ncbi:MAG: MATE family efflux transporter [Clostridiales bacterium]|nr:MATE family efflux transporter [Clostridia bacterium]MCR4884769.1 MATE family efflux transporter [Clostridiales bacterium]
MFSRKALKALLLPLLFEQLLIVLVGMMDTVMVASCGEASVSGVSLVDSINVLLIQFLGALATGGAVVTSQFLGHGDLAVARSSAKQLYYIAGLVAGAFSLFCLVLRPFLLSTIFGNIEQDVMDAAMGYFLMTALSFPFLSMYNASAALLRSMGRSDCTLSTSLIMNLINIAGNAITIYGFGMGALGAGLATLISRAAASVYIVRFLRQPSSQIPFPDLLHYEHRPDLVRKILSIGLPNGFENSLFQFGKLLLVRMVAGFGTTSIAANAVANTVTSIQVLPGSAVSLGMITVVGQCVGAHRMDEARRYTWRLMRLVYLLMGSLNILMLFLTPVICVPFHLTAETEHLAKIVIVIHGIGSIVSWPMSFVFPNSLRAAGDARFTMIISSVSMLVFRLGFGYILSIACGLGLIGIWLAMQIDWLVRIVCFLIRFHGHTWETKALV